MAQLNNSSAGVLRLRTSLNQSIEKLKRTKASSDRLVEEIHQTWADHQYDSFKKDYNEGTGVVMMLFKKMEEFDKLLQGLQAKLKNYEDLKVKSTFRK